MNTFLLILLSALASLVNLPIASSDFRFSAGIIVLMVAVIFWQKPRILWLGTLTGLAVCLTRLMVASIQGQEADPLSYFLEVFFYLGYVLVYHLVVVKANDAYGLPLVVGLSLSDFGGNVLEFFVRLGLNYESFRSVPLSTLVIGALVRSVIIILLVYLSYLLARALGKNIPNPLARDF